MLFRVSFPMVFFFLVFLELILDCLYVFASMIISASNCCKRKGSAIQAVIYFVLTVTMQVLLPQFCRIVPITLPTLSSSYRDLSVPKDLGLRNSGFCAFILIAVGCVPGMLDND
ncbi:hypothetical protein ACOSQ4_026421 [Xanthoceras sorbifolium]